MDPPLLNVVLLTYGRSLEHSAGSPTHSMSKRLIFLRSFVKTNEIGRSCIV